MHILPMKMCWCLSLVLIPHFIVQLIGGSSIIRIISASLVMHVYTLSLRRVLDVYTSEVVLHSLSLSRNNQCTRNSSCRQLILQLQ